MRELTEQGRAIYELDERALASLAPDLIVTQALCDVCAVSYDDVRAVAEKMDPAPKLVALDPHTLGEMLGDVRTLAQATDAKDAGTDLVQSAAERIDRVRLAVRGAPPVSVAALEWLDPVFVAGHWTPQLIEYAGGVDLFGMPGERSETRTWEEIAAAKPDVVVCMPCGYDAERALEEAESFADELAELGAGRVVAVDAAAYFSRPGPAAGRRPRADGAHPASRPGARGAGRGAGGLPVRPRRSPAHEPWPRAVRAGQRLRARSIDSSASSRGYQPSTLTTFQSGVL